MTSMEACSSRMRLHQGEPTLAEILADPIVKAMMSADGVDPKVLGGQLRKISSHLTGSA